MDSQWSHLARRSGLVMTLVVALILGMYGVCFGVCPTSAEAAEADTVSSHCVQPDGAPAEPSACGLTGECGMVCHSTCDRRPQAVSAFTTWQPRVPTAPAVTIPDAGAAALRTVVLDNCPVASTSRPLTLLNCVCLR